MKTDFLSFLISAALVCVDANAAEFQNLGFDTPELSHLGPVTSNGHSREGTVADLLPGWTVFLDRKVYNGLMYYSGSPANLPGIIFIPPEFDYVHEYYITFDSDFFSAITRDFSIQQVGHVPAGATELLAYGFAYLYMNGIELPWQRLPGFNQSSYDVHQFSGQDVLFEIRNYNSSGAGGIAIDLFGFTTPEPSEWALLATGGGILWWATRCASRRSVTGAPTIR